MDKEKYSDAVTLLGAFSAVAAGMGNLLHCLFTIWLTVEQLETGWGYGTDIEMAALLPWMLELLCVPGCIAAVVFFLLCGKKKVPKRIRAANGVLYGLLVLQTGLVNLFIFN